MKTSVLALLGVAGPLVLMAVAAAGLLDAKQPVSREQCDKLAQQGNFKDAYAGYRALALDPKDDPMLVGRDLHQAISCLVNLGRTDEIDAFREAVIEVHKDNWRLLEAAAQSYLNTQEHYGIIVAGKFVRGQVHEVDSTSTCWSAIGSGPCNSCFRGWNAPGRTPIARQRAVICSRWPGPCSRAGMQASRGDCRN